MTTQEIAKQNDLFRSTMFRSPRHKISFTERVATSGYIQEIITAVRAHEIFTIDNDPHGEHDFGTVVVNREKYFWKIDYYDADWEYGVDPKEETPNLLMTVMHVSEY